MSERIKKIRNIGIIAHIDAGKTTTTERFLYYTGRISKVGEVHEGTTITDSMKQERERGITIKTAAISCQWQDLDINLLDTPGHIDFTIEVERSLRVLDGAVVVLDGVEGIQAQTKTVWAQADRYDVARMIFINKLDRMGADFYFSLKTVEDFGINTLVLALPVGKEADFKGIIDLVTMRYLKWTGVIGEKYTSHEIPNDMLEISKKYRTKLLETISVEDEIAMEKFLSEGDLTELEIKELIRKGIKNFVPVLCGSAYKNVGIELLLDSIYYLPSPLERGKITGKDSKGNEVFCEPNENGEVVAIVSKTTKDKFAGGLIFIRIYSGSIKTGTMLVIDRTQKRLRVGRLLRLYADSREEITEAGAGDIIALISSDESVNTGDTLHSEKIDIVLEQIIIPPRVISIRLTPVSKDDSEKLGLVLSEIKKEDPSIDFSLDKETNQLLLSGVGDLQLEIVLSLLEERGVKVNASAPLVSYREKFVSGMQVKYQHKKQSGGAGQYAVVDIIFEVLTPEELEEHGEKLVFVNKIVGGVINESFIPSVKDGIEKALLRGPLMNSQVIGLKARLIDGEMHPVDSSSTAFFIAGYNAAIKAMKECKLELREPIMSMVVYTPVDYVGTVVGDLSSRGGIIKEIIEEKQQSNKIIADVPLSQMFSYIKTLRALTQGNGNCSMIFSHYSKVPDNQVEKLRATYGIKT